MFVNYTFPSPDIRTRAATTAAVTARAAAADVRSRTALRAAAATAAAEGREVVGRSFFPASRARRAACTVRIACSSSMRKYPHYPLD